MLLTCMFIAKLTILKSVPMGYMCPIVTLTSLAWKKMYLLQFFSVRNAKYSCNWLLKCRECNNFKKIWNKNKNISQWETPPLLGNVTVKIARTYKAIFNWRNFTISSVGRSNFTSYYAKVTMLISIDLSFSRLYFFFSKKYYYGIIIPSSLY